MKTLDPRRSKTLDPRRSGHQARAKGPLARANVSSRPQISAVQADQVRVFRETRKARERERLERFRSCRLNSSSTAASNVSKSVSITRSTSSAIPAIRCTSKISSASNAFKAPSKQTLNVCLPSLQTEEASKLSPKEGTNAKQASSQNHILPNERRSMLELLKVAKIHNLSRYRPKTFPKAEVKLNKTTRLRMLKSDPLLEFSQRFGSSSNQEACIKAMGSSAAVESENKACSTIKELQTSVRQQQFHPQKSPSPKISKVKAVPELSSSSLKRTAFSSPLRKSSAVTPKPSPLREKLAEWLEERNQSMDNFKHLQCFGVLGPVVRRPRTPYCKPHLSASMLKVIPESTESSPNRDIAQDSFECNLNTTFTLDEEDKENIDFTAEDRVLASRTSQIDADSSLKDMDQAAGILSELFKLIKIGYPANQCDLWLRAVRRRFPQCGDLPVYWECLASLDEARGDLQSALSCYENAILQGAEGSVQMSLSELLKKMASLQIVPTWSSTNGRGGTKKDEKLNLSNIIRSSAIQFEVQENCNSSSEEKPVFTATPVRRSTRLALTPVPSLPGITCVRSLDFLEPNIRSSLVFHGNSALDPKD